MSEILDLTRNSFESGLSSAKWVSLCRLYITQNGTEKTLPDCETNISNSVLVLYISYPGDSGLQDYLKYAVQTELLSVSTLVKTFLAAARAPDLHIASTLDMLCRVALDAHYASGRLPLGSVVSATESVIVILGTVQDALYLLRTAHTLPISHFHQLATSAGELLILLLSCVEDISQVSTTQAMIHFADANDLLQTINVPMDVKTCLEGFVIHLSVLIGDDAKAAREAQMLNTIQMTMGKGDMLGASSDTDIVTLSLLLNNLVVNRGRDFGAGNGPDIVAVLIATLRWNSWSPNVFYTQLLLSAFMCLSQCAPARGEVCAASIWRAFIVGRLPNLLLAFEATVKPDPTLEADWSMAMKIALSSLVRRTDILGRCDQVLTSTSPDSMQEDSEMQTPSFGISRQFVSQLVAVGFLDPSFAMTLDPTLSSVPSSRLMSEAQEAGMDLEAFLASKFATDMSFEDVGSLLDRVWHDPAAHSPFAIALLKCFTNLKGGLETEAASHLCKLLYQRDTGLLVVSLHIKISDLVFQAMSFLETFDCEVANDPQTAVRILGDVILFVQYAIARFQLNSDLFRSGDKTISSGYLRSTGHIHSLTSLPPADVAAFEAWKKNLFDSDGIEDSFLRTTQPKLLLRISPTLVSQAILATSERRMSTEELNNGVAYFLQPLLNWTLVNVVHALIGEIQRKGFQAPIHLEILQSLLLSAACPRPVLCICSPGILRMVADKRVAQQNAQFRFDAASVRRIALECFGLPNEQSSITPSPIYWEDQPIHAIRDALALAREGKALSFDIDRCLAVLTPTVFLGILWKELCAAASVGDIDTCRRLSTFILTIPSASNSPTLLPLFLHSVIPSIALSIERQNPAEQTMRVELLGNIVASALVKKLHLERAFRHVHEETASSVRYSSTAMVTRLAVDLTRRNNRMLGVLATNLASSAFFLSSFPFFRPATVA